MTDPAKSITDKLAELGTEPDEIAENLRDAGIGGCGKNGDDCPLYHYLAGIPGVEWVSAVGVSLEWAPYVRLPEPAREFIRAYDAGAYPFPRVQP